MNTKEKAADCANNQRPDNNVMTYTILTETIERVKTKRRQLVMTFLNGHLPPRLQERFAYLHEKKAENYLTAAEEQEYHTLSLGGF
jgi:hypothetical protein